MLNDCIEYVSQSCINYYAIKKNFLRSGQLKAVLVKSSAEFYPADPLDCSRMPKKTMTKAKWGCKALAFL